MLFNEKSLISVVVNNAKNNHIIIAEKNKNFRLELKADKIMNQFTGYEKVAEWNYMADGSLFIELE